MTKIIFRKSSDIVFITELHAELLKLSLNLQGLPEVVPPEVETSNLLIIILSIVSGVLGVLLVGLAVLYFIQSRSYNRQIKVLNETSFGSHSDDMNKHFKPLPNTNIFSNERSNPVMNNSQLPGNFPDIMDTQSIISTDSDDFAGLHDNPIFNVSNGNIFTKKGENSSYI